MELSDWYEARLLGKSILKTSQRIGVAQIPSFEAFRIAINNFCQKGSSCVGATSIQLDSRKATQEPDADFMYKHRH